jgi:flagellar biosynthesis protein FlhA
MAAAIRLLPFALPIALVASVLAILIPMPTGVMDVLLAANMAVAVLILLTTVSVRSPLEFSVFPSLLLATTLSRLVLNIATTRLILTDADSAGSDAAGGIIQGFGQFVAGGELVVGAVIFLILVIVQFLVITKGATRISEVAARFALDGLQGRQVAIDADLSAGVIDHAEAHRRRNELNRQADFYAAMDGASKFLRGDALAGLVIMVINIAGGLFMGVAKGGMAISDALELYTKLTIGDGLVSQLPAFLISLGAGLLITRTAQPMNLSTEFWRQMMLRPEPLLVAALFLGTLVFAQLPAIPLIVVGGSCVGLALFLMRQEASAGHQATGTEPAPAESKKSACDDIADCLSVDPLELEVGLALLRLVDPRRGGELLDRVATLRQQIAKELGLVVPKVRIRDNMQLTDNGYRIKLFDVVVATGVCYPGRVLASGCAPETAPREGIAATDPSTGDAAAWVDPDITPHTPALRLMAPVDVLAAHLKQVIRRHADELLTRDATKQLLDRVRSAAPAVVDDLVPGTLKLGGIQQVLKGLLRQGTSIRNLPLILERLGEVVELTRDPDELAEAVRARIATARAAL